MENTEFREIEKKWQARWEKSKTFETEEGGKKKKFYCLEMFPYPSGEGLHIGHAFNYTIGDIYARFKRMNGFNVLYPMGYDSFGLPAENAAIKAGEHPKKYTEKSIANFIMQQKMLGLSYDWSRLISTSAPEYYKWNQYFFIEFLKRGLAYRKKAAVNYCPQCDTVLANEQVHNGKCWRHSETNVEIKQLEQWFLRITDYAEELLSFVDKLDWPEKIKAMQKNWIGRSEGTGIEFEIDNKRKIQVESVEHFRENINIGSRLKIKDKEFGIKETVKFRFDDGGYYLKLFLDNGHVLADDLSGNSFILVKEEKTGLDIRKSKIDFNGKKFDFVYMAHAIAEGIEGEEIFKKGDGETFWDYKSRDGSYLSLGIIDETKERLDFSGEIVYSKDIQILNETEKWPIFTTRPDTLFGVTFLVISAQHPRLMEIVTEEKRADVENFLKRLKSVSEKEMADTDKEGAFTGSYAIHPMTGDKVPIWTGNFVLAEYGSGMVMAVPSHDRRDFEFAKKYSLPIKLVIQPEEKKLNESSMKEAYEDSVGVLVNSGEFSGLSADEAKTHITKALEAGKKGKAVVQYKLRDWLVSRQRYWGTPIPVVYCDKCGIIPVAEKELPVLLPEKVKFGEGNPLVRSDDFVKTKCPKCNGEARRETDTMDTFFDSSWYFLRFCSPNAKKEAFDRKAVDYWMPVDLYIGGAEHACMHLIYARFFVKVLRDMKLLKIDEPFVRLFNQGLIHGSDGNKMSKSLGNVVNPMSVIEKYSADALRLTLVSLASPDKPSVWNEEAVVSGQKFIGRVMEFFSKVKIGKSSAIAEHKINSAIKAITGDIECFRYNIAVIKLRETFEFFEKQEENSRQEIEAFLKMLSVFCPYSAEEFWARLGNKELISLASWPVCDEKKINEKFEQQEKAFENTVADVLNILRIMKEKKGAEGKKVFVYTIPNEKEFFNIDEMSKRVGKPIKVFASNDSARVDPENRAKRALPGRPAIYVE